MGSVGAPDDGPQMPPSSFVDFSELLMVTKTDKPIDIDRIMTGSLIQAVLGLHSYIVT